MRSSVIVSVCLLTTSTYAAIILPQNYTACPNLPDVPAITSLAAQFPPTDGSPAEVRLSPLYFRYLLPKINSYLDCFHNDDQIVAGDTVASALWASIQANATYASALAMTPTTVIADNPVFTSYDLNNDPNCWWSATTCVTSKLPYIPAGTYLDPLLLL